MTHKQYPVGFIATGDEVVDGDILNSNVADIAATLKQMGVTRGLQINADDTITRISQSLAFLLDDHAVVILIGGLGPTKDDLTRFAVSETIKQDLVLHEDSWQRVQQYFIQYGKTPTQNNQQQCLFPANARLLPNMLGTADGAHITLDTPDHPHFRQQHIFMLPGPPSQCLPIAEKYIYPFLNQAPYQQTLYRKQWLLVDASESIIADQLNTELETITEPYSLGYRFDSPYLEVKIACESNNTLDELCSVIAPILKPFIFSHDRDKASVQLKRYLNENTIHLHIHDQLTHGLLNQLLLDNNTYKYLNFNQQANASDSYSVTIKCSQSLESLLQKDSDNVYKQVKIELNITQLPSTTSVKQNNHNILIEKRMHQSSLMQQTCEWICIELLKWL